MEASLFNRWQQSLKKSYGSHIFRSYVDQLKTYSYWDWWGKFLDDFIWNGSVINAAKHHFGDACLHGCYFHFCQSTFKQVEILFQSKVTNFSQNGHFSVKSCRISVKNDKFQSKMTNFSHGFSAKSDKFQSNRAKFHSNLTFFSQIWHFSVKSDNFQSQIFSQHWQISVKSDKFQSKVTFFSQIGQISVRSQKLTTFPKLILSKILRNLNKFSSLPDEHRDENLWEYF